jgi:hypothetical protein
MRRLEFLLERGHGITGRIAEAGDAVLQIAAEQDAPLIPVE